MYASAPVPAKEPGSGYSMVVNGGDDADGAAMVPSSSPAAAAPASPAAAAPASPVAPDIEVTMEEDLYNMVPAGADQVSEIGAGYDGFGADADGFDGSDDDGTGFGDDDTQAPTPPPISRASKGPSPPSPPSPSSPPPAAGIDGAGRYVSFFFFDFPDSSGISLNTCRVLWLGTLSCSSRALTGCWLVLAIRRIYPIHVYV